MSDRYTQGIAFDGAAILKDGVPITIDEIVATLNGAAQAQAGDGEAPVAWLKPAHELVENSAPDVVTAELRGATIARGGIAASCMENYSVPLYKKQPAVNQQLLDALRLAETSMLDSGYSPQSVTIITVKAAIAAAQEQVSRPAKGE